MVSRRYHHGVANIHVRDVPPRVHRMLKARADRNGRSVNAEILDILEEAAARERKHTKFMAELRRLQEKWGPRRPGEPDLVDVIRRDRDTDHGRL